MRTHAEQIACSFKGVCSRQRFFQLQKEREKLEAMVEVQLKQGKSLSSDFLLKQSSLVDKLVVQDMILGELKEIK